MDRRRVLAVVGTGLASLAGCLSESPATPSESSETGTGDRRTETATDGEGTESGTTASTSGHADVKDIVVRKAVTYESTMGSGGVLAGEDRQYVVASVTNAEAFEELDFTFETAGDSWEQGLPETVGARNEAVAGIERPYLAFTVPSPLSASNPRIRRTSDDAEWSLPDSARETLAAPAPRFELDSLTAPESVSQGEQLSVSLTATNVSETDGRFLAAVYWPTARIADDDESHVVERSVTAGDSVTAAFDIDTQYTAYEDGPVTLSVAGHVTTEREIRVDDTATPT